MDGFYYDIEADNLYLYSTKIWYIKFKSLDGTKELKVWPFREENVSQKIMEWVDQFPDDCLVVFHNGLSFDSWMLWKFLGIQPKVGKKGKDYFGDKPVVYVDTFVLSQYLQPDLPSHSLAYLSAGSEEEKMDFRKALVEAGLMVGNEPKGHEFSFYSDVMEKYCDVDVDSGIGVFIRLWKKAKEMYGEDKWIHPSFRQLSKDYFLYAAQAHTGVKFDIEKAKALLKHIDEQMSAIKQEVDPKLPPRPLKTAEQNFYRVPAAPYKKNGEWSANMLKWLDKHNAKVVDGIIHAYGVSMPVKAGEILPVTMPMEIEDNTELKQYFLDSGWIPHEDFWNLKKDPNTGKPERDAKGKVIKTTPKIQHAGQLCPNLLKLNGDIPAKVVKFLSYRNRRGVVQGWLDNPRIEWDGRLSAEMSGYTPTSRVRHKTVVNCPKADVKVLLGAEMRDLFTVEEGYWYGGTDAAALENRTLASYTYKYDDGKFARMQIEGDPHCYSEDTEILTRSGWKRFGNLVEGEEVAQWENGVVSFTVPSHIVWQKYVGKMVHIKSGKVDSLVTPNHRVPYTLYKNDRKGVTKVKVAYAEDFLNGKHRGSDVRFPTTGRTNEQGIDLSDDEIRLIVAVQADGSFDNGSIRFEFSKERKIKRLTEILDRVGISYSIGSGHGLVLPTTRFRLGKSDYTFIKYLTSDKQFSVELLKMSYEQCEVFIDEVVHWDGTLSEDGATILDTTCKESRDICATVASLCNRKVVTSEYMNKSGNLGNSDCYRAYIAKDGSSTSLSAMSCSYTEVDYDGMIGCVSVPSTFILVRRNGRIIVSGNTFNAFAFFPHLHKQFDINNQENKEDPAFKPWRNKAKTGAYLLAFGGGAAKLASSLGLSKAEGQAAYDNYWTMNEGLGKLKENAERYFETKGKGKYLPAVDGRIVTVRGKNVLLSCLGQGCGAIAMSYAACLMDSWLGDMYLDDRGRPYYLYKGKVVRRTSMVHDEYSWEIEDGIQEEIRDMTVKAIVRAGELLNLSLPLNGEGKLAYQGSWKDVH